MKKTERHTLVEINNYDLIKYDSKNHLITTYDKGIYCSITIDRIIDSLCVFTFLKDGDFMFNSNFFHFKNRLFPNGEIAGDIKFLDSGFFLLKEAYKYYEIHTNPELLVVINPIKI